DGRRGDYHTDSPAGAGRSRPPVGRPAVASGVRHTCPTTRHRAAASRPRPPGTPGVLDAAAAVVPVLAASGRRPATPRSPTSCQHRGRGGAARSRKRPLPTPRTPCPAREDTPPHQGPMVPVHDHSTACSHLRTKEIAMSRYPIPGRDPRLTVVIGWDNPLATLFAQVFDPALEDDEEADLLWIGTRPQEIPTIEALQAQLAGWAII